MKEQPRKGRFSNGNVKIDSLHIEALYDTVEERIRIISCSRLDYERKTCQAVFKRDDRRLCL